MSPAISVRFCCAVVALMMTWAASANGEAEKGFECKRLVVLSPSLTELAFSLGLGEQIAGVARFSNYPPEALGKPVVGGLLDLSFESILQLKPDFVLGLNEHREVLKRLEGLGISTRAFEHRNISGILSSVTALGELCARQGPARMLRSELESRLKSVSRAASVLPRVRAMVIVGDGSSLSGSGSFIISGSDGFYSDILHLAGGENVQRNRTALLPAISAEGILSLNPEVIIEVMPARGAAEEEALLRGRLASLPEVQAVREGRVHVLGADYAVVPGPRFVKLLEEIFHILHPEEKLNG